MNWLNYHHLLYFWTMAREGSISRAAERLHLSQPTISGQLRLLEQSVGSKLYERKGREIRLTETGRLVYEYAEEIFTTGQEMMERLKGTSSRKRLSLCIGIPDYLPKLIVSRLIDPVFDLEEPVHLVCVEGSLAELLADLALHRLDLVLSDSPVGSQVAVKAYNHPLGDCGVTWVATPTVAARLRKGFPRSLNGTPLLVPTSNTLLRRSIEQWLDEQGIQTDVVAEIQDSALMKALAAQGRGLAPVADAVLDDVTRQYNLSAVGPLEGVRLQFFGISAQRKVTHPAVVSVTEAARARLFAN